MLKDSEGIQRILDGQQRELEDAKTRGDASAATLIAGRKAWVEEFVIQAELLAVAELGEKLAGAEEGLAEAEAAGDAAATQSAKVRVEAIQAALRSLQDDESPPKQETSAPS